MRVILLEKYLAAAGYATALGAKRRPSFKEGSMDLGSISAGKRDGKPLAVMPTRLTWANGHLLEPVPPAIYLGLDPEEDAYAHWDWDKLPLLPPRIKLQPNSDLAWLYQHIAKLLRTTTELVLATDGDDEGELIGYEILQEAGYKGPIHRCMTSGFGAASYRKALDTLYDPDDTVLRAEAAAARRDKDWKIGFNMSPAASLALIPPGVSGVTFPVGRVKTPVLAMVVLREREIRDFKPETFYGIDMTIEAPGAEGTPEKALLSYRPGAPADETEDEGAATAKRGGAPGEHPVTDRAIADQLGKAAAAWQGTVSVKGTPKKEGPPALYSGTELLADAVKRLGRDLGHWEKVRQSLYEKGAITYPRAPGECLEESCQAWIPGLMAAFRTVPSLAPLLPADPIVRVGRGKTFDDAALDVSKGGKGHHAIVPNVIDGKSDWTFFTGDEQRLFEMICHRTAMSFMPDHEYRATVMSAEIDVPADLQQAYGAKVRFKATGRAVLVLGWRAVLPLMAARKARKVTSEKTLPAIAHGTSGRATGAATTISKTKPPPYFDQADLIQEMGVAHKYIPDPDLAAKLKMSNAIGIGTDSTKPAIIEELLEYELIETDKDGKLHPTPAGETEYDGLKLYTPELVDPGISALLEHDSGRIRTRSFTREQDRQRTDALITNLVGRLKGATPMPVERFGAEAVKRAAERNKPTPEKLDYARSIAAGLHLELPAGIADDRALCTEFIDTHVEQFKVVRAAAPPNDKQLELAQAIAGVLGLPVPDEVRTRAQVCSAWIDEHIAEYKEKRPPLPSGGATSGKRVIKVRAAPKRKRA